MASPASVLVVIANYDFSQNASLLKLQFAHYFETIIIDASSPNPPRDVDISIPNTYYPGLWNASVNEATVRKSEWLMFVASDLIIDDTANLSKFVRKAITDERIGIYTPSLAHHSRCSFRLCLNQPYSIIREAGVVEGFFFLARTHLLKNLYPIPATNKYGWGVDIATCYEAYRQNFSVVVDDRISIFHPRRKGEHDIPDNIAGKLSSEYLGYERSKWWREKVASTSQCGKVFSSARALELTPSGNIENYSRANECRGLSLRPANFSYINKIDFIREDFPFPDSNFEYVVSLGLIQRIPRVLQGFRNTNPIIKILNEVYRVLTPGGVFFLTLDKDPLGAYASDPTILNPLDKEGIEKYLFSDKSPTDFVERAFKFEFLVERNETARNVIAIRARK